MEPVLGGRDDSSTSRSGTRARLRRNGARPWRTGRPPPAPTAPQGRRSRNGARPWRTGRPQAVSGLHPAQYRRNGARPWRTGRPFPVTAGRRSSPCRNGARPWRTGRQGGGAAPARLARAAMEPVLGGRDDPPLGKPSRALQSCRNGARPWRTGRLAGLAANDAVQLLPQWSPSLADGTTPLRPPALRRAKSAAMEPVLGGRDDPGRNRRRDGPVHAAMEPVLGGRDDGVPALT